MTAVKKLKKKIAYNFKKGEDIYLSIQDIVGKFTDEMTNFEDKDACFSDKTKITILIEEI